MTSPASGRLNGGPWRQGVAVTSIGVRPGASSRVLSHAFSPRAPPPSRRAPDAVVTTTPAEGSSVRPAGSRLSSWWSCVSSTASSGPTSSSVSAGPISLREPVPQPKP